jgi:hypothetical protein
MSTWMYPGEGINPEPTSIRRDPGDGAPRRQQRRSGAGRERNHQALGLR